MTERLQKIIAGAGVCSRRTAEEYLRQGRVSVNGKAAALGDSADPERDRICLDGKIVSPTAEKTYIMLHKPRGYTCTLRDAHVAHPVTELVDCTARVYPVGRLDKDSEGLLLLTDDGDFMQMLTHPGFRVDKVYLVWVTGMTDGSLLRLREMRLLDGEPIAPAQVEAVNEKNGQALLQMTIHQGKNRQIRRMCAAAGLTVTRLKRIEEHGLSLGKLPLGQWRYLTDAEILMLRRKSSPEKSGGTCGIPENTDGVSGE